MIDELLRQKSAELGIDLGEVEIGTLVKYAELIVKWNRTINLVATASAGNLVRDHIVDCLAAVPFIDGSRIVDVGAGAGLPGIVIAILRPQSEVFLVESRQRKARFLRHVAIELGLHNISIVAQRIETWQPDDAVDFVVCRGYGALGKFIDDTRALHHVGCQLVAMKGASPAAEIAALSVDVRAISVRVLTVPGWRQRHLVTIDSGKLSNAQAP